MESWPLIKPGAAGLKSRPVISAGPACEPINVGAETPESAKRREEPSYGCALARRKDSAW